MTKDIDDMTPEEVRAETARLKAKTAASEAAMTAKLDQITDTLNRAEKAIEEKEKRDIKDD